jgi:Spy/CpxP family protein refolding chaperone
MKKKQLIHLAILLLCLPATLAFAKPDKHQMPVTEEQRQEIAEKIFKRLDLDTQQDREMRVFFEEHKSIRREMQDVMEQRKELHKLLRSSITSDEEVRSQANKTAEQFIAIQKKRLDMMLQVKSILRPEQFERLLQIMTQVRQRAFKRMGNNRTAPTDQVHP